MKTVLRSFIGLVVSLFFASVVLADSPVDLSKPDSHSVEVKGKVSLYRVQVEGMDMGMGLNKVHAEVFVSLDSQPGMIYTLALHNAKDGQSAVNKEIADTLRTAYLNKTPVTLYHQIPIKRENNFKILMVQLD
ncbi:MAG TPA: hypothetical protein ENI97_00630 [Gammaproteobacteria bacterium]|nr:hypothetical protein [Gammaproteobacteria bacterium]